MRQDSRIWIPYSPIWGSYGGIHGGGRGGRSGRDGQEHCGEAMTPLSETPIGVPVCRRSFTLDRDDSLVWLCSWPIDEDSLILPPSYFQQVVLELPMVRLGDQLKRVMELAVDSSLTLSPQGLADYVKPSVEKPPIHKPSIEKPPVYKLPVEKPPIHKPPIENHQLRSHPFTNHMGSH
ncbi:Repetitive proline-rich cell wall protein 1 [Spatholobus suberectus]|nr:Repetitive proline-rich cell wall protein 1 [Spatholobus suberectus]